MIKANKLVKTFTRNEKNNKKTEFNAVDGISFSVNDDSEKTEIIKDLDLKIEKNKL